MPAELPARPCPACWTTFTPTARNPQQRYCSPACRVEHWRRREQQDTERLDARADKALRAIRAAPDYDGGPVWTQLLNELKRTRMDPD